jgi:hypothetical protein
MNGFSVVYCGGRLDFSAETLRSLRLCGDGLSGMNPTAEAQRTQS